MRNGDSDRTAGRSSHADEAATPRKPFASSRQHRDGPFFLYLAHSMPHIPLARSAAFEGHSSRRHLRRRRRGDRRERRADPRRAEDSRPRPEYARRLHERQRSVAAVWRARRIGRVRSARARAPPGKAACGRRRSSGGRARSRRQWSPESARRWICSQPPASSPAAPLPRDRSIDGVDLRAGAASGAVRVPAPHALLLLDSELAPCERTPTRRTSSPAAPTGKARPRREHNAAAPLQPGRRSRRAS